MNYYNILNLPLYSDIKDIKNQYLNLLKSTKDDNKIKELNKIYTFLKDPLNKFNYDNQLKKDLEDKTEKSNLDNFYDELDKNKITDEDVKHILIERKKLDRNLNNIEKLYSDEEINNIIKNDDKFKELSNLDDDNTDFKPISTINNLNFNDDVKINNDIYKNVDELYKKSKQDKDIDEYIKARDEELKVINSLNKK